MTTTARRVELGVLVALLLLAVFVIWQALSMPMGSVRLPGPGMMPLVLGSLLALSTLVLLLTPDASAAEPALLGNRPICITVVCLIGAGLLLEPAGFVATAALFLFVMLWMASPLGWWRSAIAACVASYVTKLAFADLLGVTLPPFPWLA